jgi:folate-binding protein YgfZ
MQAALLPDRGVVKVAGDEAGKFLNGLITVDTATVTPGHARYAALLTPQGKIIADFIVAAAAPADGGGYFLDVPRALAPPLVQRLNLYRLRAKVVVENLSDVLGVLAAWGGSRQTKFGLAYADPRLPALGLRCMLPPHLADQAIADLGAQRAEAADYEAHRIALGVPRGELDFAYSDAFPHEADMDQLHGVDFTKGCFVGQEVVSRMAHRGTIRARVVPVAYDGTAPEVGTPVLAGEKSVGTLGSTANRQGLALLRLDRAADAIAAGVPLLAGVVEIRLVKPAWARFAFPGDAQAAE